MNETNKNGVQNQPNQAYLDKIASVASEEHIPKNQYWFKSSASFLNAEGGSRRSFLKQGFIFSTLMDKKYS